MNVDNLLRGPNSVPPLMNFETKGGGLLLRGALAETLKIDNDTHEGTVFNPQEVRKQTRTAHSVTDLSLS